MSLESRLLALLQSARSEGGVAERCRIARTVVVGEFDDHTRGRGFAIFMGPWRAGWWPTRREACEVAEVLTGAIGRGCE